MGKMRKITVEVPEEAIEAAIRDGESVSEAVRQALADYNHKKASRRLLAMEGKLDLGLDLDELRKDKDEE